MVILKQNVIGMYIEVVTKKATCMTPQCGRSEVQILVVRVDLEVVIYEAITPQCGRSVVQILNCQSGFRSGDL